MEQTAKTAAIDGPRKAHGRARGRTPPVLAAAVLAALAGAFLISPGAEGAAREDPAAGETAAPSVAGFRSARFGMSKAETLEAIQRDFQLRREDIQEQSNDEDRTSSLVATVTDIFPGSDPARVLYIHGHKQGKLIQVNILWGEPVAGEPDPQALVTAANILRKHFAKLGFDPAKTVVNTRVDDSAFIVFRATDDRKRMVLLQLISRKVPGEKKQGEGEEPPEPQNRVVSLWLSYIENTVDPDVFRIEKGKF